MSKHKHEDFVYEEAGAALRNLLYQLVSIKKKRLKKITYKGPEILSSSILASNPNIQDHFSMDGIEYDKEQGRDVIDIFINKVFQLGYSVGIEKERAQNAILVSMLEKTIETKNKIINHGR